MKLVDLEGFKFDLSGLAYILPTDFQGIGEYFMRQLRDMQSAEPEETFEFGKWYDFKRGYVLEIKESAFRILKDVEAKKNE